ncbi:hypothetical protein Baya_9262 [Bagarius yarrelli]|uniref:Uncharacterized protein n=1 Tax=Bagarius yarrelli TaxID=175774 RepID=A0A556U746_BAGYA|nr:hypothetical protein Baya_9262 [Bagarius yarrelli]
MEIHRSALSCCVVSDLPNVAEYAAPRDRLRGVPQSIQSRIGTHPSSPPDRWPDHHSDTALIRAHWLGGVGHANPFCCHHGDGLSQAHQVHKKRDGDGTYAEVQLRKTGIHQRLKPPRRRRWSHAATV